MPPRCCRYCQQSFQPSQYRPDQAVCGGPLCQRRRRADYHRHKIETDPEYAQGVCDSRKKWRQAHPGYQQQYWRGHNDQAERNRRQQTERDRKRRLARLVKNNLALNLKQAVAEVWLFGPAAGDLVKNNLASSRLLIFQPLTAALPACAAS